MAALGVLVHIHGRGRVFKNLGTSLLAGISQPFLSVVLDKLLAKSIDKIFRAAGNDKLIWLRRGERHRVADHIAPQSARGSDDHGIVLSRLHGFERNGDGIRLAHILQGDELVEHAIVEHQQHGVILGIILYAEESFRGIVGLHVVYLRRGDDLLILLAVRRKGDAAVEKHL